MKKKEKLHIIPYLKKRKSKFTAEKSEKA